MIIFCGVRNFNIPPSIHRLCFCVVQEEQKFPFKNIKRENRENFKVKKLRKLILCVELSIQF